MGLGLVVACVFGAAPKVVPALGDGGADCATFTTCESCASATSWVGHCRWCPRADDGACHAAGSFENRCDASQEVTNASLCDAVYAPTQVHLAFAGVDGAGMAVSWNSRGSYATGNVSSSAVQYGRDASDLAWSQSGKTESYLQSFQHTTLLSGSEKGDFF